MDKIDKQVLKQQIIEALNLEDKTPEDIKNDEALFDGGLGLDSIDALELFLLLDKHYGIKILDKEIGKSVMQSINTLADYIDNNRVR